MTGLLKVGIVAFTHSVGYVRWSYPPFYFLLNQIVTPTIEVAEIAAANEIHNALVAR